MIANTLIVKLKVIKVSNFSLALRSACQIEYELCFPLLCIFHPACGVTLLTVMTCYCTTDQRNSISYIKPA